MWYRWGWKVLSALVAAVIAVGIVALGVLVTLLVWSDPFLMME